MADGTPHRRPDVRQAHTSRGEPLDPGVPRDLSELARALQAEDTTEGVMQRIVIAAVTEIDGAVDAAITLLDHGKISSPAHTSERAVALGEAECRLGEGPCVDTSRLAVTLRVDDLRGDDRWPQFAELAVQNGVRAMLSFQLFVAGESMGALNVYSDTPDAFDAEAENTGLLLAAHAAIALKTSRQQGQFRIALDGRDLIGQAKGVLIERYKIDALHAFDLLTRASQATNRKLRDVAEQLVTTGELATPEPRSNLTTLTPRGKP